MRVVVADDTLLTREGIVRLLRDAGIEVVAEAQDAQGLLHQVRLVRPDVALVDIRMPPTHTDEGLVAAQTIRAEHPQVGVLVLSQYVEPSYALRLLQEQPERVGYLLKERVFDIATVVDALRRIVDGETVIDPTIVSRLVGRRRRQDPLAALSQREREVLGLIAEGLSNRAIAARLYVTERTVEAHGTQTFQKLRLPSRPTSTAACWPSWPSFAPDQAVRWAASNGKVRPDLIAARMPQDGQGFGTGSSRTRTVDQGSALHPACACPAPPERHADQRRPVKPGSERGPDQRFRWSGPVWSPHRNRTGDPILTMEPPGTAVRMLVFPGRARP